MGAPAPPALSPWLRLCRLLLTVDCFNDMGILGLAVENVRQLSVLNTITGYTVFLLRRSVKACLYEESEETVLKLQFCSEQISSNPSGG